MKIQPYVEKLMASSEYKDFTEKHKDAFMVAGFFILDLESGKNLHQIDYYVPSEKKVAAFTLDGDVNMQMLDTLSEKVPEPMDIKTKIDLDELPGILKDEMKNRGMTENIVKIIAVIQKVGGKKIWNLNCILSGMNLLRSHVEDESKTVLKMEKSSMMDMMKQVQGKKARMSQGEPRSKEEADKQIEKLEALEKAIEEEKGHLKEAGEKAGKKQSLDPQQPQPNPTPEPSPMPPQPEPTPAPEPEPEPTEPAPPKEPRPEPTGEED